MIPIRVLCGYLPRLAGPPMPKTKNDGTQGGGGAAVLFIAGSGEERTGRSGWTPWGPGGLGCDP